MSSSEHRYRQVFDTVPDGLLLLEEGSAGLRLLAFNSVAADILGLEVGVGGSLIDAVLKPTLAATFVDGARASLTGETVARQFALGTAGGRALYQLTLIPIRDGAEQPLRLSGVIRDITQQRGLESALHARAMEFRALVENAPDLIARYDTAGRILYTNPAIQRLGRSVEEIRGLNPMEISPGSPGGERCHACVMEVARTGRPMEVELFIDAYMSSRTAWHHIRFVPERDEEGNVVSVLGIGRDITEMKSTEAKLRALTEHLSLAADVAQLGIMTVDLEAGEIRLDERMRDIYGFASTVVTRPMVRAIILPEDLPHADATWETVFRTRSTVAVEYRMRRPDGEIRWLEGRITPHVSNDRVTSVIAALWDVTQRKQAEVQRLQLEAQLRQAQKLEAIGTLAGGIAHDFNNILGAILGNAALLAQDLDGAHPASSSVAEIHRAAQRGKDLVQRLLAFGRPQDQRMRPMSLSSVAEEVLELLRPTLPATIEITLNAAEDVPAVRIDAVQISQVLMNLCVNACQAMDERKGRIDIEIGAVNADGRLPAMKAGRYVVLSVRDDGRGMSPEVLERIFEPFYTTKPFGEGSGLGLAMVHGIVRAHEGAITVRSAIDGGTTFDIYLPALPDDTPVDAFEPPTAGATRGAGSGERILYIDDEEALVFLAERYFKRLGYRPECFTDPQAAIGAFRAEPERYDLVITDLSMPGTSGMDVARALLAIDPRAKVVLASGYVRPSDIEAAQAIGIRGVILKPNTVEEMAMLVQDLLAQHQT